MTPMISEMADVCVICGREFSSRDPPVPLLGWTRDMVGQSGAAHYLCICRLANERSYRTNYTPWDIGRPHPALVDLVDGGVLVPGSVFEPGPGRGDNALFLAARGFEVTVADISQAAVSSLRERATKLGLALTILNAEVLYGLDDLSSRFDYVFERSFLQTLPSELRPRYVSRVASLLHEGGLYVGIIRGPREPPPITQPFAFSRSEILQLFGSKFDVEITPTVSGHGDANLDFWLIRARLR